MRPGRDPVELGHVAAGALANDPSRARRARGRRTAADDAPDRARRSADRERRVGLRWVEARREARRISSRALATLASAGRSAGRNARVTRSAPASRELHPGGPSPGCPDRDLARAAAEVDDADESRAGRPCEATAPSHASRPSSSAVEHDDRRARRRSRAARTSSSAFADWRPGAVTIVSIRSAPVLPAHAARTRSATSPARRASRRRCARAGRRRRRAAGRRARARARAPRRLASPRRRAGAPSSSRRR